jgi:hypothetical protein
MSPDGVFRKALTRYLCQRVLRGICSCHCFQPTEFVFNIDIEPLQISVSTSPIRTETTKSPVRSAATPFKKVGINDNYK